MAHRKSQLDAGDRRACPHEQSLESCCPKSEYLQDVAATCGPGTLRAMDRAMDNQSKMPLLTSHRHRPTWAAPARNQALDCIISLTLLQGLMLHLYRWLSKDLRCEFHSFGELTRFGNHLLQQQVESGEGPKTASTDRDRDPR